MSKRSVAALIAASATLLPAVAMAQPAATPDKAPVAKPAGETSQPAPATGEGQPKADQAASGEASTAPASAEASEQTSAEGSAPISDQPQPAADAAPPDAAATPLLPSPRADSTRLQQLGNQRPSAANGPQGSSQSQGGVFAEDWWSHARPAFEIHGYFRTRAELFHNFSLGRLDSPSRSLWAPPADDQLTTANNDEFGPTLCTADERGTGESDDPSQLFACQKKTQAGANLRFRLNPELHVSDNLRVLSQVDLLDNLVLGSTPEGYRFAASADGGYEVVQRTGYNQVGFYDNTQVPPDSSSNSLSDSIVVKRAWAEYTTPVGEVRFGRMPNHWGLGIVANSGDGYDDDYQSTVDRIMFMTGLKPLDLVVGATWDFPNEGATGSMALPGAQPYDLAQLDDVDQYSLIVMRRKSPKLEKLSLSQGDLLVNGGLYLTYRTQLLANDMSGSAPGANVPGASLDDVSRSFSRRGADTWVPDLWLQLLYKKFRFEAEAAAVLGSIESLSTLPDNRSDFAAGTDSEQQLRQYGLATELEQKLVEDRLRLRFNFGWASGDPDAFDGSQAGNLIPGPNEQQVADDTISTFRFHPAYRVDMILHRYILNRVQGTYYFRPGVEYDFVREPAGQRIGGGAQVIWSRASEFVQTPGHATDLGLELNGSLYYQSRDGALNDNPDDMGGFYTMLQYGVLFPLAGLGYQNEERVLLGGRDTSAAQILRWYLGVLF